MTRASRTRTTALLFTAALALCSAGRAEAVQRRALVRADGTIDYNRYYTAAQTNQILAVWARRFPGLTRLYSIGKSYKGQELMVIEVTNEATGSADEKPALYLDGGIHAGELTGSAVATYVLGRLLHGYGKEQRITRLLDTRALYIRPKFNPDGSDLVLAKDEKLRSTVHPFDDDGDGVADEDPPDDLDKDNRITQMRVRSPDGDWVSDPADPRSMRRRTPADSQGTFWIVETEGIDNDRDGRFNEDGVGGLDMNRNFPRNWERQHIQDGAGSFPLSEPETRATVDFLDARPNVTSIVHGHTSGGFVYRLPSASDPSKFDRIDLALIEELGAVYTQSTGRPVQPSATHPTDHRYGTLISWGYWDRGIIGWVPEYSPADAWITDYDGDGRISEAERLRFNDEELGGRYFTNWTRYAHPQLGEVEVGGWYRTFWGQNPPAEYLEKECEQQIHWILWLLEQSPLLTIGTPVVRAIDNQRFRVEATITNTGYLPTNMTERGHTGRPLADGSLVDQVAKPPIAILEVTGGEIEGPARTVIGHLAGVSTHSTVVHERARTVSWIIYRTGRGATTVRVSTAPGTGGVARSEPVVLR
ncbi:MAG: M14 family metallopeptidase [Gemmatimonadetes bacterium]|nr:M14 family metallopeptidase [Gemmatimonadota bacterium]